MTDDVLFCRPAVLALFACRPPPRQALRLESAWKAEVCVSKINSYNPRYQAAYEDFVLKKSASSEFSNFFKNKQQFYNAISLAHNLSGLGIYERVQGWANSFVDFLDPQYNAHNCIAQMHALAVMIVGSQKRFISKEQIAALVFEALKACAEPSVTRCVLAVDLCSGAKKPSDSESDINFAGLLPHVKLHG